MLEAILISEESKKSENGVGGTPIYQIFHDEIPKGVRVLAKVEGGNPTGSIKDRAAERIIMELLRGDNHVIEMHEGGEFIGKKLEYQQDLIILDSSSGNYGVSLSYFGGIYGVKVQLVVPGNTPKTLIQRIRNNGVEPVVTDASEGYHGALTRVRELAKDPLFLYVNQYDNWGNFNAHYYGTGREIWEQTNGKITHFVAGVGTAGTITGAASYLKDWDSDIEVYSVHPDSDFPGIQGLQPFIDGEVHSNLFIALKHLVDGKFKVTPGQVDKYWGQLRAKFEVGMSSGANFAGVLDLIRTRDLRQGTIVTMFPDHFDRYIDMFR